MEDKGHSNLKQKVLDLITNLRLESDLLDDGKDKQKSHRLKGPEMNPVTEETLLIGPNPLDK